MRATHTAWIALGANLGRRGKALERTRAALTGAAPGLSIEAVSREVLTRAAGLERQPDYHNQVVRLRSSRALRPAEWLRLCQVAERAAGRLPTYRWGPRRADADILLLGDGGDLRVSDPSLSVPHARLGERPFLWRLLAELSPDLAHPDGWRFVEGPVSGKVRRHYGR